MLDPTHCRCINSSSVAEDVRVRKVGLKLSSYLIFSPLLKQLPLSNKATENGEKYLYLNIICRRASYRPLLIYSESRNLCSLIKTKMKEFWAGFVMLSWQTWRHLSTYASLCGTHAPRSFRAESNVNWVIAWWFISLRIQTKPPPSFPAFPYLHSDPSPLALYIKSSFI